MKTYALVLVAVLAVVFAGCKKDGEASGTAEPKGPSKEEQLKTFTEKALPEVQAAVAADGPKVEFEAKLVDRDRVIAAAPKGWSESKVIPGNYEPPQDGGLGFMTRYSVGTNCDGTCSPKDWKATADKVDFAQFAGEQFQVVKDEALKDPAGRVLVATAEEGKRTYVTVARWTDGASRYYVCRATLDEEAKALVPAFEKACTTGVLP